MSNIEPPTIQIGIRLPHDLIVAVDVEVERLKVAAPWTRLGRSEAIRSMLLRCIERDRALEARAARRDNPQKRKTVSPDPRQLDLAQLDAPEKEAQT